MNDADRFKELDRLFQAVCDLPPEQQAAKLVELAPGDEHIQSEVLALLQAEDSALGITPESFHQSIAAVLTGSIETPESIGNYRIIQTLGQGGMGIVYEAKQQSPQRTVALKLLRPGLATPNSSADSSSKPRRSDDSSTPTSRTSTRPGSSRRPRAPGPSSRWNSSGAIH